MSATVISGKAQMSGEANVRGGSKCPVTRGTSRPTIYRHFIESAREESATASPPRDNDNEPAGCRGSCRDRCSDGRRRRCRQKSRPSHIRDQRQRQCYRRRVDSDIETALRRERLCFFSRICNERADSERNRRHCLPNMRSLDTDIPEN